MENTFYHTPVLLKETIELLNLSPKSIVVDGTCGEGGHSLEILKLIPDGKLLCVDRDKEILERAKQRLSSFSNAYFININFNKIEEILAQEKINKVDAILADLGISLFHLKNKSETEGPDALNRGFSYTDEFSLDMRLDTSSSVSAGDVVNHFKEEQIADILYHYGEEYEARKIARAILRERPISSSKELGDVVARVKKKRGKSHPATKTFQALRIFVNKELEILESFIPHAVDNLSENGRVAIISYHSLEDRIVKHCFKNLEMIGKGMVVTKKPIIASQEEIRKNRPSRSAKLRAFEVRGFL
jgi:16S rRNA (cytosine1402-N4)-methyltransferase